MIACRSYVSHAKGSVLKGIVIYRCPLWPDGRRGPNPPIPLVPVEGQRRRGPLNVLVADALEGPWALRMWVVPARTLRRVWYQAEETT